MSHIDTSVAFRTAKLRSVVESHQASALQALHDDKYVRARCTCNEATARAVRKYAVAAPGFAITDVTVFAIPEIDG
jgi:hypothetical protein